MVKQSRADGLVYCLGGVLGFCAGMLDIRIADLLLTALFVTFSTMLLGALRPERPWRWIVEVASCVPALHLVAYFFLHQRLDRAHLAESFVGFLTGAAGGYGGALGRKGLSELFK
jgi:hypothetical protein